MKMRLPVTLSLVCACILSACAATANTWPTQAPRTSASIRQALPNAAYPMELTSTGKVQLKDGVFEESVAPGSATKTKIRLGKEQVFGDVNADGIEDAMVTLVVDPGGSGTFTYLALVLNERGTAKPLAAVLLGDRIILKSMAIQSGRITVTILSRKPDEPMSAEPKVEVTRTFKLQGDTLIETK
jgi:hypothetical protein